ncbi:MAG: bifunctional aspartate kinase/homoserine dehydrogenase I, partial [Balneolaceae bacterium]
MNIKILKFGGSSVGSAESLEKVARIIRTIPEDTPAIIVVSALKGITDQLLKAAKVANRRVWNETRYLEVFEEIKIRHLTLAEELIQDPTWRTHVQSALQDRLSGLEEILHGVYLIRECSNKTLDLILSFGEQCSATLVSGYLQSLGMNAPYLDSRPFIKTDDRFGNARVNMLDTETYTFAYFYGEKFLTRCNPSHFGVPYPEKNPEAGTVRYITTGFIGSTLGNETTTLGRGGSDYTAALFASVLRADEIEIWTDVNGLMTANPTLVDRAFSVSEASYEEAMELSHFGAKVIYPPTIQPARKKGIPIRIKNTFDEDHPGTVIRDETKNKSQDLIRGISSISNVALITVRGSGMVGVTGIASRLFQALAKSEINVILITQSSSEHTISLAVLPAQAALAIRRIEEAFELEIDEERIDPIEKEEDVSIVAVVGDNMRQTPGIAARVFSALGRNGINIRAIAQGSSERNISFVLEQRQERKALNTLHDAFFLGGVKRVHLFLIGVGLIGRRLLELLDEQADFLYKDHQIALSLNGVANSKKMLFDERGILGSDWKQQLEQHGEPLDLQQFSEKMREMNLSNSIFIDATASESIQTIYEEILKASISVVTPNKKANSSKQALFDHLQATADKHNAAFRYETNVGAGLPLIGTMSELVTTGDRVHTIQGVLSGTLSYIFNRFDGSEPFSTIVRSARELGYTEPDPREDLNGRDVGRKILILARVAGFKLEFEDVEIENLVPEEIRNIESVEEFMERLPDFDELFEKRRADAAAKGEKLCYIASFDGTKPTVALESIGPDHPFFGLSGSDNIVALHTRHYHDRPMVIKGPGAGADVTAGGIIHDILRVTNAKAIRNSGI